MNPELNIGDNVRCLYMPDEHSSVPPGTFGIVKGVHVILGVKQYDVIWENGSKLALLSDADIWDKGERTKKQTIKETSTGLDYLVKNDDVWEHFDMKFLRKYLLMVRDSGIVNMLQSAPYLYMGRERLEHEFKYSDTNGKIFPADTISIKNSNASFKLMSNKTKLALDEGVLTFDLIGKADKKGWLEFKINVVDEECPVRIIISENEMDAPNFFSPNEDGVNEYWYVPALAFYPKAKIIIFDRYGKIISTLDGTQSWNGTMNGIPMASGDYWYTIQLDQKLPPLKGNITLIR